MTDLARSRGRHLLTALLVLVCLAAWQAAVTLFHVKEVLLPTPTAILASLWQEPRWYLINAGYTLLITLASFVAAAVVGVLLGVLIVESPVLEGPITAFVIGLNSVPKVALAPLFVIWLGTGWQPKVAIGFLIAVFAVVIDTVHGLKSVPREMLDLAHVLRGRRLDVLWRVRFPYALPAILSGMKVAISLSLVGAIVGEFVSAQRGLGYVILTAQGTFDTPRVFAAIVLLAIMGVALFGIVTAIERRCVPWHASQQR